jgi:hypothetical protein
MNDTGGRSGIERSTSPHTCMKSRSKALSSLLKYCHANSALKVTCACRWGVTISIERENESPPPIFFPSRSGLPKTPERSSSSVVEMMISIALILSVERRHALVLTRFTAQRCSKTASPALCTLYVHGHLFPLACPSTRKVICHSPLASTECWGPVTSASRPGTVSCLDRPLQHAHRSTVIVSSACNTMADLPRGDRCWLLCFML